MAEKWTSLYEKLTIAAKQSVEYKSENELLAIFENALVEKKIAVIAGKIGELKFAELFIDQPEFIVINTATIGKHGDFIIEYTYKEKLYRCLVDIKNYTSSVQQKEVVKFNDDLNTGNYDCGLFLSLRSKITGIKEQLEIREVFVPKGKIPCAFLTHVEDHTGLNKTVILKIIQMLFMIVSNRLCQPSKAARVFNTIKLALNKSMETRRSLTDLSQTFVKCIDRCKEDLMTMELIIQNSIADDENSLLEDIINLFRKEKYDLKEDEQSVIVKTTGTIIIIDKANEYLTCDKVGELSKKSRTLFSSRVEGVYKAKITQALFDSLSIDF